ncbi:carbohydrate ABC transporter permease [Candidatus Cryosericum terrychapinii]|jgi:multiple sugar transport system permease protein|uniref:Carbohydrate ABC transporter permease n=1 Tax=Candidatus Cryosericum terrychapinii TaxID=2290919 RepID=A0A398CWV6_9BACT|nr:carbohydrate ABC transporter permease [Candidatus Cryosericum terrychapinii]RIE06680.1 carbohydrate ABC transporter permease [Candidatus Cryosericum terrychapinii]
MRQSVFWNRVNRVLLYLGIAVLFILVVFPFYWMIVTSLQPQDAVFSVPPQLWPKHMTFQNYIDAWNSAPWLRYFGNTLFVAVAATLISLATSSLAAFAFACIDFRGKEVLFNLVLSVMMIPAATTLIPNFLIIRTLGWYDKFYALIIPFAASVFGIFLLRQYFMSMPKELWEAAQIDGASRLRYFRSIALPLAKPAIVTIAINSFLGSWTSFLWPTVMTQSQNKQLIEVALNAFLGEKGQQWSQLAAASVFTTIPIVILFFFVQRQFIEGIGGGGIKG